MTLLTLREMITRLAHRLKILKKMMISWCNLGVLDINVGITMISNGWSSSLPKLLLNVLYLIFIKLSSGVDCLEICAEVNLQKLSSEHKALFRRAKMKEVSSFLKNEAVRKCLNNEEVRRAYGSQRIIKARWALTWKPVPPDERAETLQDSKQNLNTMVNTEDFSAPVSLIRTSKLQRLCSR